MSSIFRKNVCLQLTFESIETQFWVTKTVWQRIPSRRARHRKAPTTETVLSIARYDQLPLSGRTQMLTASDFCRPLASVGRHTCCMAPSLGIDAEANLEEDAGRMTSSSGLVHQWRNVFNVHVTETDGVPFGDIRSSTMRKDQGKARRIL